MDYKIKKYFYTILFLVVFIWTSVFSQTLVNDGTNEITLKEITTPAAIDSYGKVYPKTDNQLYFQDGAGAEKQIISAPPMFSVHKNGSNQVGLVTSTSTKITWSTEVFDVGGYFASNKFTPQIAGKYLLFAQLQYLGLADAKLALTLIYKNGASVVENYTVTAAVESPTPMAMTIVEANGSSDYFEVYGHQQSGGNADIVGTATVTFFQGYYIGP